MTPRTAGCPTCGGRIIKLLGGKQESIDRVIRRLDKLRYIRGTEARKTQEREARAAIKHRSRIE